MSFLEDRTTRGQHTCPWCNERNDAALSLHAEPRSPKTGDMGICFSCTMPMIFQEFGSPRVPTESEWNAINSDETITRARREVFMSNAKIGKVEFIDRGTTIQRDDD